MEDIELTGIYHYDVDPRPTWTHDVGPGQDELNRSFVHHLGGQQEGELVEQSQCGNPGFVVMPDSREILDIINKYCSQHSQPPE